MTKKCDIPARVHKEFMDLINQIRAQYLLRGKKPPGISTITRMIAKELTKKGDIEFENFIPFT